MGQLFAAIICNIETADTVHEISVGIVVNLIISERTCFKESLVRNRTLYSVEETCFKELPRMLGVVMAMKAKGKQSTQIWRIISEHAEVYVCMPEECGNWKSSRGEDAWVLHFGGSSVEEVLGFLRFSQPSSCFVLSLALLLQHGGVGLPLDSGTASRAVPRAVWRLLAVAVAESNSRKLGICGAFGHTVYVLLSSPLLFLEEDALAGRGHGQSSAVAAFGARARFWSRDAGSHETPTGSRFWSNLLDSQVGAICPSRDVLATKESSV